MSAGRMYGQYGREGSGAVRDAAQRAVLGVVMRQRCSLLAAVVLLGGASLAACAGDNPTSPTIAATQTAGPGSANSATPTVQACPSKFPTEMPPSPAAVAPWSDVRAALPRNVVVLKPVVVPPGLGAPFVAEACTSPAGVPQYTVVYAGGVQPQLVFILTQGAGAWGNFPGPPTVNRLTIRGADATLMSFQDGPNAPVQLEASWTEAGQRFLVRSSGLSQEALLDAIKSMAPVP